MYTLIVKRLNHVIGQAQQIVALNHLAHHRRANPTRRQADNAVHIGDGGDDFLIGNDDPAAATRQPQFGQTHAQDNVRVPQRACFAEDDAREGHAIGVINHQRNAVLVRQHIQLHQLFVSDHVPGWVGRTRDADHPRLFTNMQVLKIDVIFELAFR